MTNLLYDALLALHLGNDATFVQADDGGGVSYDAFVKRAAQMAHVLAAAGVRPGDRVIVQAPKLLDTLALYGGAVQAGGVYVPLNTAYTQAEVSYFAQDAMPRLIVCDADNQAATQVIAQDIGAKVLTLAKAGGSLRQQADTMPTHFDTVQRGAQDLAALLYTSGTTGRSKGAMLSHNNLLSNARVLTDLWQITHADRLIHALPVFHTHGLFVAINTCLLAGAQMRLMAGFDVDAVLTEMPQSTLLMGVPTFYTRLLADDRLGRDVTKRMRLFISGSAPLLAETHTDFHTRTGHYILERYGMTETNMIASNPYDGARVAGTVGYPLAGVEVRITDMDSGTERPVGEIGMIEVRGDNVFQGYWNMPEKTAEEIRPDGFFITGDLGISDAGGRISIVGRAKDLIIAGGYNIYPKEIEDVLNDMEGVIESAVFGVPHPDFGESVVAAVVVAPVASGAQITPDTLREGVAKHLAKFKHPREYILMDALPRNTMGKVQKNLLRQTFSTRAS